MLPPIVGALAGDLVLVGIDLAAWLWLGKSSPWWHAINNVFVVLCVVGITNLWAQSGMKARDAAILAGALALYDLVATSLLPLMGDLFTRLAKLPLTPLVAWPIGSAGQWCRDRAGGSAAGGSLSAGDAQGVRPLGRSRGHGDRPRRHRRLDLGPHLGAARRNLPGHGRARSADGATVRLLAPTARHRTHDLAIPAGRAGPPLKRSRGRAATGQHIVRLGTRHSGRDQDNASSSVRASTRSVVSNPSVNHA